MSGYRDAGSGYDPYAYDRPGKPLRPYNWVQWTGVGFGSVGLVLTSLHLLGEIGWIPQWVESSPAMLMLLGFLLINSRREPDTLTGSEQLANNRRILVITLVALGLVLVAAIAISFFTGA